MKNLLRTFVVLAFVLLLAAAFAVPAFAWGNGSPGCNSGNGNGSEIAGTTECDPGNSAGHNNGGD
jgi:hypothetical protein